MIPALRETWPSSNPPWLSKAQMDRLKAFLPKSHDEPRVVQGHNLHQSQWLALAQCAWGIWPREDALQPLEALARQQGLRPALGGPGHRARSTKAIMIDATSLKRQRDGRLLSAA